jgi:acetyl-CoA carboxylase biotin carboxyl carrier protein
VSLSDDDVREILRLIDESDLDELHIETEGFSMHVLKGPRAGEASRTRQIQRVQEASPARVSMTEAADQREAINPDGALMIESPMLGTFYRAERPGAEPLVDVGAVVEPGTIVCIIEVMKMMNSVPAGVAGTVEEVCCENAQLVEYGQPLFRVKPS